MTVDKNHTTNNFAKYINIYVYTYIPTPESEQTSKLGVFKLSTNDMWNWIKLFKVEMGIVLYIVGCLPLPLACT